MATVSSIHNTSSGYKQSESAYHIFITRAAGTKLNSKIKADVLSLLTNIFGKLFPNKNIQVFYFYCSSFYDLGGTLVAWNRTKALTIIFLKTL